ncbi:EndoU domain-containing protein [Eremococcus coleocola]|uniref:Bacterial EndoU nuclease domain-containing protein n=1 Tax=Eremococcus coleocola ACS-139-V-Col8 TaxID=908337 RepID=E4KNS4_9LACT|nr:EndoU domain-containing protein [Eremococcus coleocola]EFR31166.1 hypothetical protein HMPREF9257_1205 [Eremococcus coleocola ACS-139-V-Col8]
MKKLIRLLFLLVTLYSALACQSNSSNPSQANQEKQESQLQDSQFRLSDLENTQHFNRHALEHIFYGSINRKGNATGYHYEGISQMAQILPDTRSKNDKHGVYRAKVKIEGQKKKAMSTFFPKDWSPQEVVDAINEAYDMADHVSGNIYEGASQGITIQMYLTDDQKIISAFPIYER